MMMNRKTSLLLNLGHALDHLCLLIFATAVTSIATEFGFARWEDLMPYSAGAFLLFGIGSVPAGRLGDLWGRRSMMGIFFFGIGAAAMLCAAVQNAWQMAAALALLGAFSAIYHPVGIPMLLQHARNPGLTIGVNGLAGNLGIAVAAILTGLMVKYAGWRAAFIVPALLSFICGFVFLRVTPAETENTCLVGDFRMYAYVARRQGLRIDIGWISTDFTQRQKTIRAYVRTALVIRRKAAFCKLTGI